MLFIPENELEKALVRAAKDPGAAPDFYRLLLSSELLVLGSVEGHETDTSAFNVAPGSKISLVTGSRNGSQYLPIFSSLARMQDYVKQESKYLSINGRDLLDFTRGAPVILNPASEYGKELTADNMKAALDGIKDFDTGGLIGVPITIKGNSIPVGRIYRADVKQKQMVPASDWIVLK